MLLKMLLQSVFICCLMFSGVARAIDDVDAAKSSRDKRSVDFGVFLKNLLQKSADLSNSAQTTRAPRPKTTPTTTTTTTTAAPIMAQPFVQKSFYKTIPGVGRVGFGFGFAGNLGNQPFFYPIDQRGGYIDFDYNDNTMATATTAATSSTTSTTTTTEAPTMMSTQRPRPRPRPVQNMQRRPALLPNAPQPGSRILYVPAPYYNTQTPAPRTQHNFATAPINYDYYDPYNAPQRGQPPRYDFPTFYRARQSPIDVQPGPTPEPATSARPIIITPITALNGRAQLSDNLIYQFSPKEDIYSREEVASNVDTDNVAEPVDGTDNPPAEITGVSANANDGVAVDPDDYNDDSGSFAVALTVTASPNAASDSTANNDNISDNAATVSPNAQSNDANIDYADNSAPSDISGPHNVQLNTQNYGYDYDAQQNEVPYSLKSSPQKQGLFVYTNQLPKGVNTHPSAVNSQSSFATMRFRSPFANFHTTTVNDGHSYNRGQQFQRY